MEIPTRSLMYIDMAYTMSTIRSRKHEDFFRVRHLGEYFDKVWGVHPLSDIGGGNDTSKIQFSRFSSRQLIVEGVAESMPWPRFLVPLNFFVSQIQLLFLLIHLIRKHNISAIIATDPYYSALMGLLLKVCCRKPLVISIYGHYDDLYEETGVVAMPRLFRWRFLEKIIERINFFAADLVVGGSQDCVSFALKNGVRKENCVMFPTSVHMQKCHFVDPVSRVGWEEVFNQFKIPLGRSYLLYIGRLVNLKHPDDALRAMRFVIEKDPSVIGIFAGDGPMRDELEELVVTFGLTDNIIFLGNVDQEILSKLIPLCITLAPITGMAMIEAGLAGSSIVAYDRDWHTDFIKNNDNGFIVKFRDHDEMGEKALKLIQNPELRCRFSSKIRETALAYADLGTIIKNQQEVYEKMFAKFDPQAS